MSLESAEKSAVNGIRTALGIGGVLAVIVGILILVWPGRTAAVVTAIIAIYAIAAGLVYAGLGIFSKAKGGWSRLATAFSARTRPAASRSGRRSVSRGVQRENRLSSASETEII